MSSLDGTPLGLADPANLVKRGCGSCTLCCKLVPVVSIEKPRDTWCPHCDKKRGCKIYDDRPTECRLWSCLWTVDGDMREGAQPHKIHCVFDVMIDHVDCDGEHLPVFQLWVDPAYPGAFRDPVVRREIDRLYQQTSIPTLARLGYRGVMIYPPSMTRGGFIEVESNTRPTFEDGRDDWQIADYEKRHG